MQLLVISDTHGAYAALRKAVLMHPDVSHIIHCGDGQFDAVRLLEEFPELKDKFHMVRGNCDYDPALPPMLTLELPFGHRLLALHGHRQMYGDFVKNLLMQAQLSEADIVAFGHLHTRIDRYYDGIRLFNPGSAGNPRDGKQPSFGLIDITESGILTSHGNLTGTSYPMQDW